MSPWIQALRRFTASPAWLRSRTGRLVVALAIAAAGLKTAELFGITRGNVAVAGLPVVTCLAVALALWNLRPHLRATDDSPARRRAAWWFTGTLACIGASALANGVADALLAAWRPVVHPLNTALGVAALVCALAGVRALPAESLPRRQWLAAGLDLTTLSIGTALGFWVYAVQPAWNDGFAWRPLAVIVGYAALSLILLGWLLLALIRQPDARTRRGLPALVTGGVLLVVTEIVPFCHLVSAEGLVAEAGFLGWTLFALALALAARLMREAPTAATATERPGAYFAIPFASTGLVGFLLFTSLVSPQLWEQHVSTLLPAMFLAIVLIVVRQTIIARENFRLAQDRQRAKEVAETVNSSRLHFLANISHDLRTPLNGVLGCSQILLRDPTIAGKHRELVQTMQGCGEHLRNLINDLLDLSKLEADRLELAPAACDVRSFFEALTKTFSLEADNKGITLTLDTDPSAPAWILADRKRLQQILGNLVHNAIKFTDRGGVRVRLAARHGRLLCDVHDTGCGILPDKIGELFRPFHVVDARSVQLEGTGLGLSIAKRLAQKMGGDIRVQSVVGRGSTFTLDIPYRETAPVVEERRTIVDYRGRRRRILIVDDEPANRIVLRSMLEPLDFLVDEAGDARAALEQIQFARPDIVLIDLMLPGGLDGYELARRIGALELPQAMPCLAVSALSGEEVQQRCRAAGLRELLHKPVNLDLLLDALHLHAGIEWTFGVLQPPPTRVRPADPAAEEIKAPPPEEIAAFRDLVRRGFVRNIESRATRLAQEHPEYTAFARRVGRYTRNFKLKELAEWLASLAPEHAHGSS